MNNHQTNRESCYKGQTVQVYFVGSEDYTLQTSFVIDDTALNVS